MFIKDGSNEQGVIPEVKEEPSETVSSNTQNVMFSNNVTPVNNDLNSNNVTSQGSAVNPNINQGMVNPNNVVNQNMPGLNSNGQMNIPSFESSQGVFSNAFDSAVNAQQGQAVNQNFNQSQSQAPLTGSQTSESLFE